MSACGVRSFKRNRTVTEIALELLRHRDILALRTERLVADVVSVFPVAPCVAYRAVEIARANAGMAPAPTLGV